MAKSVPANTISHWSQRIIGLQVSPKEFFARVQEVIEEEGLEGIRIAETKYNEGGMFSAKRAYLTVKRKDLSFDICGAPHGKGFFVSWWLQGKGPGFFEWLASIPILGWPLRLFLTPLTYYQVDTMNMFQSVVHQAVLSVVDEMTQVQGAIRIDDMSRKPVMRNFFAK